MLLNQFLLLSAVLFCLGVYGVLARNLLATRLHAIPIRV